MKKTKLFILSIVLLTGCNNKTPPKPPNNLNFIDSYKNELKTPEKVISNRKELIYALDYMAFYKIKDKVSYYISDSYASTFYSIYSEFNKAISTSNIADNYPNYLNYDLYDQFKIITVSLSIQPLATNLPTYIDTESIFINEFDYKNDINKRDKQFEDFPLYLKNNGFINVNDSESLWYAILQNYYPITEENSIEDKIFNEAKNVLRRIVDDDMTDLDKVKQIYNYLTCEVKYDFNTAYSDLKLLNREQCYYLEGVFLNHYAVCDGKSKAFVLLCKLEGIDSVRVTDFKDNFLGHAYNYVKVNEKWYLTCSTFGSNRLKLNDELSVVLPSYNMFLTNPTTPYGNDFGYDSKMYEDIKNQICETPYNYLKNNNLIVENENQFNSIVEEIISKTKYDYFEIEFQDMNKNDDVVNTYIANLREKYSFYDLYLIKNRPYEDYRYACIFIKKGETK